MATKLLIRDYERDVIYVHPLIISQRLYNKSPGSLKAETFLRLTGLRLNYKNHFLTSWEKISDIYKNYNYCMPYIELNGKGTCGGEKIIEEICEKFELKIDHNLTPEQRMLDHSFRVLLNHHTCRLILYLRYQNCEIFINKCDLPDKKTGFESFLPECVSNFCRKKIDDQIKERVSNYYYHQTCDSQ